MEQPELETIIRIKFTVDADNEQYEVSWDWLLRPSGQQGHGTSLLKKWADSLAPHLPAGSVYEAALYTNRKAAAEITAAMRGEHIAFDAITDTAIRSRIITQIGSEDAARAFFSEFRFKVDRPEPETLEEGLKSRFLALHGDMEGWLNLMSEIRIWAKYKDRPAPSGAITIHILRYAARWHRLHELPQGFELPADYAVPAEDFHTAFLAAVRNRCRPCLVLWGSPGTGKSTYLSYLVDALKNENIPVIRHHYFLSLTDRSGNRFSHQVVAESLMQQIQARYSEALGDMESHNPQPEQCSEWLTLCGQYYASQNVPFVVIIDGLDEVWRARRSIEELTLLFERILPPPENVIVIVGTQRVSHEQLPPRLLTHAPQKEWVPLPALSVGAIRKWLEFHAGLLTSPQHEELRNQELGEIASAFFQISQSHPLHLRYSFRTLIERGEPVWEHTILALPPCLEDDIERYYARLLDSLPDAGRQMLHLLAACDFPWPKEGLMECLSPNPGNDAEVMEAERQIAHLLKPNPLGTTAFHRSLLVFIQRHPDHKVYAQRLLPKVIDWLVNMAPEYWRWAYEWIIRAQAGEASPLRDGPNQEWVVDALAVGRPIDRIRDILQRGAWIALDEGNLARVIELVILDHYTDNGPEFQTDEFERLLFCQIRLDADPILKMRLLTELPTLSDKALAVVAEAWAQSGAPTIPKECHKQFLARIDVEKSDVGPTGSNEAIVETNLDLAASIGTAPPNWVLDFTRAHRAEDFNNVFGFYCGRLASLKHIDLLRAFFRQPLEQDELYDLATITVRLACEEGFNISLWTGNPTHLSLPLVVCYRWLQGDLFASLPIAQPDAQMFLQEDASLYGLHPELIRFLHALFFSALALTLSSHEDAIDAWIASLPKHTWAGQFCRFLIKSAIELGAQLKEGRLSSYARIYEIINNMLVPAGNPQESEARFYRHTTHALIEIALDLHLLMRLRGGPAQITGEDIKKLVRSPYWKRETWLDRYIENRRPLMTDEALVWLLDHEQARLTGTINQLDERYADYARLAQVTVLHGGKFSYRVKELLHKAAACVIAYGFHKDYALFETLATVEACHKAGIGDTERWLFDLAPMIAAVGDFTDGDETNVLIADFAGTILTVRPDLFPAYYQYLLRDEEWYDAERAMHVFIKRADLSDPVNQAIAYTVIDDSGLEALTSRSEGDISALAVFRAQQHFLGGMTLKERASSSRLDTGTDAQPVPPPLEAYPPAKIKAYLAALHQQGVGYRHELVTAWVEHWSQTGCAADVLDALEGLIGQARSIVTVNYPFDQIFELCRALRGKSAAFPWLVRAHRERYGWTGAGWFRMPEEEAMRRFAVVAHDYKDRWLEFIQEAAGSHDSSERRTHRPAIGSSRLVKFCLAVEQPDMAGAVAEAIVRTTLERTADLHLPLPSWIPPQ